MVHLRYLGIWVGWVITVALNWLLAAAVVYTSGIGRSYTPGWQPEPVGDFFAGLIVWAVPCGGQTFVLYTLRKKAVVVWWAVLGSVGWSVFWMGYNLTPVIHRQLIALPGLLGVGVLQLLALHLVFKVQRCDTLWWLLLHAACGAGYPLFSADSLAGFVLWGGTYGILSGWLILRLARKSQRVTGGE